MVKLVSTFFFASLGCSLLPSIWPPGFSPPFPPVCPIPCLSFHGPYYYDWCSGVIWLTSIPNKAVKLGIAVGSSAASIVGRVCNIPFNMTLSFFNGLGMIAAGWPLPETHRKDSPQ